MNSGTWRELNGRALLWVSLLLLLAGALNDPPWKWYSPTQQVPLLGEPAHVVASLLAHQGFANPYATAPTGPTAHVAPLFPFIQFVLLKSFGTGAAGWIALRWLATLALGLQFALLPFVARALGYNAWIGVLASLLGILAKPGKQELWEAHLAGLACLILTLLFCRLRAGNDSWPMLATIAALGGIATLLQPVIALPYLGCILLLTKRSKQFVILALCPLLLCVPWMLRNHLTVGSFGLRNNLGLELSVSFNDCAPYGVLESQRASCSTALHPNANLEQALELRNKGELAYNADRFHRATSWMQSHPGRTAVLLSQRFWFFWFPSDEGLDGYPRQRKRVLVSHALTIASLLGVYFSLKRKVSGSKFLFLWLALFPPIYYVVQFESRYRYPILWITWLLAAYALSLILLILSQHLFAKSYSSPPGATKPNAAHEFGRFSVY